MNDNLTDKELLLSKIYNDNIIEYDIYLKRIFIINQKNQWVLEWELDTGFLWLSYDRIWWELKVKYDDTQKMNDSIVGTLEELLRRKIIIKKTNAVAVFIETKVYDG